MLVFAVTEKTTGKARGGVRHEHLEQFTEESTATLSAAALELDKPLRMLIAIRSPQNLYMLQKSLEEIDPETTDVIVMTAKTSPPGGAPDDAVELDRYDRKLITAVVQLAEKIGKKIRPIVVPTNKPLFAVINTARSLHVQELVVGASNKYTPEEQLDQVALYWISLHEGHAAPVTVRILSATGTCITTLAGVPASRAFRSARPAVSVNSGRPGWECAARYWFTTARITGPTCSRRC